MKFLLEIDCDNADFEQCPAITIANVLVRTATKVCLDADGYLVNKPPVEDIIIRDTNGNRVGRAWIEE